MGFRPGAQWMTPATTTRITTPVAVKPIIGRGTLYP